MHDDWQAFLTRQSAVFDNGRVLNFGNQKEELSHALDDNVICDLSQFDVLEIGGKDAGDFLHGQLSSDVESLGVNEMQLSSWCNIKGRVVASFLLYRQTQGFLVLIEKEMTEYFSKRLQMFIMRADVYLKNLSEEKIRIGIRGEALHAHLEQYAETNSLHESLITVPLIDERSRSIVLVDIKHAPALWESLSRDALALGCEYWSLFDIQAGLAWIGKTGTEEFLPQSLNLDLIGALSFDKGCYPGQEIIARMHFRGKLKQRLYIGSASLETPPAASIKLFAENVNQHVGLLVNSGMQSSGLCLMLLVLDLAFAESEKIYLGAEDGPPIRVSPPAYGLEH
jgi:tRNA-modifying protein YgfZ